MKTLKYICTKCSNDQAVKTKGIVKEMFKDFFVTKVVAGIAGLNFTTIFPVGVECNAVNP